MIHFKISFTWSFENKIFFIMFFQIAHFLGEIHLLTLSQASPGLYMSAVQVFSKHCGKREIARNEQFLLFPQYSLPLWRTFCHYRLVKKLSSANSISLEEAKICHLGKVKRMFIALVVKVSLLVSNLQALKIGKKVYQDIQSTMVFGVWCSYSSLA